MEDFPIADSLAGTGKAQRLDGNIQPELVSILETINYRARDAVDANGNAVNGVPFGYCFYPICSQTNGFKGRDDSETNFANRSFDSSFQTILRP